MGVFLEISLILVLAVVLAAGVLALKQPPLIGYIITGLLVGSGIINLVHSPQTIELFSKLGITVLLFIVGLHLTPGAIKEIGRKAVLLGIGQMFFSTSSVMLVFWVLGYSLFVSFFLGLLLSFSSTIVVLKLLSDKNDEHSLYGRLSVGLLLVQDIFAVLALFLIPALFSNGTATELFLRMAFLFLRGVTLLFLLWLVGKYILPPLFSFVAYSQELLFLLAIAWGVGLASIFYIYGFSLEAGALVAGVLLSTTEFAPEIAARSRSLRDFFLVLFFVLLGSMVDLGAIVGLLPLALLLLFLVIIVKPLIIVFLLNLLGFKRRVAFLVGIGMSQISEFSLILAKAGADYHYLSRSEFSLVTLIGAISITVSTYLILYAERLYPLFSPVLSLILPRSNRKPKTEEAEVEAILFGYHRVGHQFVDSFKRKGWKFLVVDFDPQAIARLQKRDIPHCYGDAQDVEFLAELGLRKVKFILSTIPDFETNKLLIKTVRRINKKAVVIVISHNADQAAQLYQEGASYVIMPHYVGADYASIMIRRFGTDLLEFKRARQRHLRQLRKHYLNREEE
jgi:Kef-type K+ transport system membrane component KefB